MDCLCKSVSKPVLSESEQMMALPSSSGHSCLGAGLGMGLGLGLGLGLVVPGTLGPVLGKGSELAARGAARGLAFVTPDPGLELGLALAVTGVALALEALGLVRAPLALRPVARGLRLAGLGLEGEVALLAVVGSSIATDFERNAGGRNCTPNFIK